MRITLIANCYERTPPPAYGGTERVVASLADRLVDLGHDVTLFATADSVTKACLRSFFPGRSSPYTADAHLTQAVKALDAVRADPPDVVHSHIDYFAPLASMCPAPTVTTLHNYARLPSAPTAYLIVEAFGHERYVAISESQAARARAAGMRVVQTVYHGIDVGSFPFSAEHGTYLAVLGLLAPHKGPHHAIRVAQGSGVPLKLAGRLSADEAYFDEHVGRYIDGTTVELLGELGEHDRNVFLRDALCLLMPIEWDEPFGLVMAEAQACGTPVIGFRRGSVPELVEDGVTGFVVDDGAEMADAVARVSSLERSACRERVRERFGVETMVSRYEALYRQLVAGVA